MTRLTPEATTAPSSARSVKAETDVLGLVEELKAKREAATPGPWNGRLLFEVAVEDSEYCDALVNAFPTLASAIEALAEEIARLREALRDLRTTAALLQQNAEGCAVNHYGQDFSLHGMPGWLSDTAKSIKAASAALTPKGSSHD
jgi:hypothetical protein